MTSSVALAPIDSAMSSTAQHVLDDVEGARPADIRSVDGERRCARFCLMLANARKISDSEQYAMRPLTRMRNSESGARPVMIDPPKAARIAVTHVEGSECDASLRRS